MKIQLSSGDLVVSAPEISDDEEELRGRHGSGDGGRSEWSLGQRSCQLAADQRPREIASKPACILDGSNRARYDRAVLIERRAC